MLMVAILFPKMEMILLVFWSPVLRPHQAWLEVTRGAQYDHFEQAVAP
jgi:hypothetical protein